MTPDELIREARERHCYHSINGRVHSSPFLCDTCNEQLPCHAALLVDALEAAQRGKRAAMVVAWDYGFDAGRKMKPRSLNIEIGARREAELDALENG